MLSLKLKTKMKLTILQRSTGRPLAQLDLPDQATVQDLQTAFHQKNQRFYPSRQQFTFLPPKDESPGKQAADSKGKITDQTHQNNHSTEFIRFHT